MRLSDADTLDASGVTDQNYLRGVQQTDANGPVSFTTIFLACYSGRRPHIHFELYPSLAAATDEARSVSLQSSAGQGVSLTAGTRWPASPGCRAGRRPA